MTCDRLRNMVALVNAAAFFTAVVLGTKVKLQILATHLLRAAKRLFGIPDLILRPRRRHCRGLCQEPPAITSQHRRSTPAQTPPAVKFLGNVLSDKPIDS